MTSDAPVADAVPSPPPVEVAERRLHPAYLIIGAGKTLRAMIPLLAVALFSWPKWVLWILAGLVLAGAVVNWLTTRYSVLDRVLRVRKGVFSRSVQSVASGRITGLDAERGVVQRLFGVWSLKVQTPGDGDKSTVELHCLSQSELDRVREALALPDRVAAVPPGATTLPDPDAPFAPTMPGLPQQEVPLATLGTRTLLIAALTGTSVPLILAGLFAVWNRAREVLSEDTLHSLENQVFGRGRGTVIILGVLVLLAVAVGVAFAALRLANFTLRRDGDRLRTSRGLLAQRSGTVVVQRVQAVRMVDGLWRRMLGYTALQVEVAGLGGKDDGDRMLFPLIRSAEVADLVQRALPELHWRPGRLTGLRWAGRRRYLTAPALVALVVGAAGFYWLPHRWALLAALPVPLGLLLGWLRGRTAGWSLDPDTVVLRERKVLAVHTVVAKVNRVQITRVSSNPWQRRAGLATVTLSLSSGRSARLRHLPAADADLIQHLVGRRQPQYPRVPTVKSSSSPAR